MDPNVDYYPSHPHLFRVHFVPGLHSSSLKTTRSFSPEENICKIEGLKSTKKAWYSLQCGKDKHFDLNSDLAYANHSCEPNIAFDVSSPNQEDWHCRALKAIPEEEDLTFFYPSTEWEMDQPFQCWCGAKNCLKEIRGAAFLSRGDLESRGYVSAHVHILAEEHEQCKQIRNKLGTNVVVVGRDSSIARDIGIGSFVLARAQQCGDPCCMVTWGPPPPK